MLKSWNVENSFENKLVQNNTTVEIKCKHYSNKICFRHKLKKVQQVETRKPNFNIHYVQEDNIQIMTNEYETPTSI